MSTEGYFIDHCEDENGVPCGLGSFNYECPECGKWGNDYDVWYKDLELYRGAEVEFKCEHCKAELVVVFDEEEIGYYISKKNEKNS